MNQDLEALVAEALYREHAPWLRRYVHRLAANRSLPQNVIDPEDVVHDAFVKLLRHDAAHPIQNPGAWLCVVVRNQVTKATARYGRHSGDDPAESIEAGATGWTSLSLRASAEDIRAAREVVDAIAELPRNQQIATYLSRVQGWRQADIAAFLGCSTSAAGVHVHRGTTILGTLSDARPTYAVRSERDDVVDARAPRPPRRRLLLRVTATWLTLTGWLVVGIRYFPDTAWWLGAVAETGVVAAIVMSEPRLRGPIHDRLRKRRHQARQKPATSQESDIDR